MHSKYSSLVIGVFLGFYSLFALQEKVCAMGWLEKKLSGQDVWDAVGKATPLIKQKADTSLTQLNYNSAALLWQVFWDGEQSDEQWTVMYWRASKRDLDFNEKIKHPDIKVYLNTDGFVKRVVIFEQEQERLIYGKDEDIVQGMTTDEVLARLGKPDRIGPPHPQLKNIDDEEWVYEATTIRKVQTKVGFKNRKVSSLARFHTGRVTDIFKQK